MKSQPPPNDSVPSVLFDRHVMIAIGVLLAIVLVSAVSNSPVRSIFPYALSVGLVAWWHGMTIGFLFAGLATLAALIGGAFPSSAALSGHEVGEGLYTYLKLSAISAGVALGKRSRKPPSA